MKLKTDFYVVCAEIDDAAEIAVLENENFSLPWTHEQICDEINKPNSIFLSAKAKDKLVGYVSGQLILDEFYISNIAVSKDFRNLGIAAALMSELINRVKASEAVLITLEVRESNEAAKRLYEKFAFVNLGIRKNFYSYPTENANIYTLYFNEEVK